MLHYPFKPWFLPVLASVFSQLVGAAALAALEPSGSVQGLTTSVSSYYATKLIDPGDASFGRHAGTSLSMSLPTPFGWKFSLRAGLMQDLESERREVEFQNTSVTLTPKDLTITDGLTIASFINGSIATNENDKVYLGYLGGLSVGGSCDYQLYQSGSVSLQVGGGLSVSREFYEYDAAKSGVYNTAYSYAYSGFVSLSQGPITAGASYGSGEKWRTDGETLPQSYSHSVYVSYQATSRLSFKVKEGLSDRVYKHDEVRSNLRVYDRELTQLAMSAAYTF